MKRTLYVCRYMYMHLKTLTATECCCCGCVLRAQSEVAALREQVEATPMPEFAQSLIAEKNAEIDHLNEQMKQLKSHGHASDDQVHIQQLVSDSCSCGCGSLGCSPITLYACHVNVYMYMYIWILYVIMLMQKSFSVIMLCVAHISCSSIQ